MDALDAAGGAGVGDGAGGAAEPGVTVAGPEATPGGGGSAEAEIAECCTAPATGSPSDASATWAPAAPPMPPGTRSTCPTFIP